MSTCLWRENCPAPVPVTEESLVTRGNITLSGHCPVVRWCNIPTTVHQKLLCNVFTTDNHIKYQLNFQYDT